MNTIESQFIYNKDRVKSAHIQSYSGPYSVQMRKNTDENNSKQTLFT